MKEIRVRFEQDEKLENIEVTVRAAMRDEELEALLERIAPKAPAELTVTDANGAACRLSMDEVIMVSVSGKYTQIVTQGANYTLRQTLQGLEEILDPRRFVRISRYEIVNLEKVRKYDFTMTGTLRLELAGGLETWASRRCIPAIRKRLNSRGGGEV